jgi:hypothetical protein
LKIHFFFIFFFRLFVDEPQDTPTRGPHHFIITRAQLTTGLIDFGSSAAPPLFGGTLM